MTSTIAPRARARSSIRLQCIGTSSLTTKWSGHSKQTLGEQILRGLVVNAIDVSSVQAASFELSAGRGSFERMKRIIIFFWVGQGNSRKRMRYVLGADRYATLDEDELGAPQWRRIGLHDSGMPDPAAVMTAALKQLLHHVMRNATTGDDLIYSPIEIDALAAKTRLTANGWEIELSKLYDEDVSPSR